MDERDRDAGLKPKLRPAYHQTRNPVTPSGRGFRAKFFSRKNRRLVRCESLLEFDALFLMEFARGIRSFEEQPVTIEYQLRHRKHRYTPDFGAEWEDGSRWFVEVKPSEKLSEPRNLEKFDILEEWFASRGDRLVVLTEKQIRRPIRLRQIRDLLGELISSEFTANCVPPPAIASGASIAELRAAGSDDRSIRYLLANRSLACDLDRVIDDGTIIRPYREAEDVALFI
ncbi:TnsA endonuclease N-terminal domain-containing protein (plasmid) [Burkholderia vietnamiensis]|uniref:TnsA endonuclease N-terminal domain-containing protein n=1 Tax=Burkholderia vietnamiensis TaxID=60552 RepID=UPI00201966FB|nr:TnsA endonuclease N-terminal domain-containing protein [Burkholderia vietnamiensis]MCO1348077.1 TnsA endonuclease N-terminal domain-containing protein [Burkholderia vietnamiensis]MCO1430550.1 TnsA endonuclease N-terminal domain-containing protein [Burkholderia vietnamiensis]UQN46412.1 TnsA endonuclease N-terminal domain-containing protein [Burkholderia vietnamiensis]